MGKRSTFTEAQVKRALKAARQIDPQAVLELTLDGRIRILPPQGETSASSEVDEWFESNG
ncbi:hypothetical protein [Paragemmobacter ruber]|uniref:Uncharacterized protein n=1 Tax=Paragemmobacter ruber TaxID=1985673 RepID=A0ABW9Y0E0_9RHOB|nr:hypothetical protein [Rhodobacter ruber]NBE05965.1 hypothetical protein [Rhodobacter ruber]